MQAVLDSTESAFHPGTHIGPYRVIKHIKRGGMSTVYLGSHLGTRAYVAMKVVESHSVDLTRWLREREIMQALRHEHIVPCLDAGQSGSYHYLVMPYMQGGTLQDTLDGNVLTLQEAWIILEQLTSALAYLHGLGLLHRDIKPANILFDQDSHLYLTDFGLVTWLGEKPGSDGRLMGTPQYLAPEILEGDVDERSDVYAVGILLYQMLTGSVPFDGSSYQICLDQWKTRPVAPSFFNPSLPRRVERVILHALEKDPRRRYQSIEEVLHAFQEEIHAPTFFQQLFSSWHQPSENLQGMVHTHS